jgi:hypothetical protein
LQGLHGWEYLDRGCFVELASLMHGGYVITRLFAATRLQCHVRAKLITMRQRHVKYELIVVSTCICIPCSTHPPYVPTSRTPKKKTPPYKMHLFNVVERNHQKC